MYYHEVNDNGNTRQVISTWLGYNHNYNIDAGEFYDMENMSSDNYPLLSPRKKRPLLYESDGKLRGLLYSDNNVAYLEGTTLHYSLTDIDLSEWMEEPEDWQTLLRFGEYILIFPVGVYVNLYDENDRGTIYTKYDTEVGKTVTYTVCDSEGKGYDNITASDTAPENPTEGMYWLSTGETKGLYVWNKSQSMWSPVATSYIRIEIPSGDLTSYFKEGDTITMNTQLDDVNEGSTIQKITDDYFVVIGLMNTVTRTEQCTDAWHLKLNRKIPKLDYVCVDKNRVWGCHYGYQNGKMLNEIYASKLGDFRNWYTYTGISTDSYAATVGISGEFTGCISYQGYPTFFKENAIIRVFGNMPSEYQINTREQRGVQLGSYRSLAVVNEYLVYKAVSDVCVYDGSVAVSISEALPKDRQYYDAVGGGCLNKYRIVMREMNGRRIHLVYDFKYKIWHKEDSIALECISATENGQLYAATKSKIYGLGNTDNIAFIKPLVGEEWVDWYAETGEMGYEAIDKKYVSRITVRAFVPARSELQVMISYDSRPFEDVGIIRGLDDINSKNIEIAPYRCDHFRLMFRGHGDCRIYALALTMDTGSEEYGI